MIIDAQLLFEDAAAVGASGNSGNILDTVGNHDLGSGESIKCFLKTSAVGGTNPTLDVKVVGADDAAFSVNKVTVATFPQITTANLFVAALSRHKPKRYYRLEYTVGGTGSPTFTVYSGLVKDVDSQPIVVP